MTRDRASLRAPIAADLLAFYRLFADPDVGWGFDLGADALDLGASKLLLDRWIDAWSQAGAARAFAIVDPATSRVAGVCGLEPTSVPADRELFFAVGAAHRGRGFAGAAVEHVLRYGFEELGLSRIVAAVRVGNEPARRVVRAAGLREVETVADTGYPWPVSRHELRIGQWGERVPHT